MSGLLIFGKWPKMLVGIPHLCRPVLGSPVSERYGRTGVRPAKGYVDDEGSGASVYEGRLRELGLLRLEKRMLGMFLPDGGMKMVEPGSSQPCPVPAPGATGTK